MKNILQQLENRENALRIAMGLLLLPMFFITGGSILCTTDTGAYLQTISNFENHGLAAAIPMDRSVFFGLFLWAGKSYFGIAPLLANLGIHLSPMPLFQVMAIPCILLLLGATIWLETLFTKHSSIVTAAALGIATLLTPLPWFIFQAMPDIFTPLLFLYAMIFLHSKSNTVKLLAGCVIVVSALMHHSHLPLLTLFAFGVLFIKPFAKQLPWQPNRIKQFFIISFLPWIITITLNVWAGNGFTPSKGSHVFLMGKLCENGILKTYLEQTPIEKNPLAKTHPEIKIFYQNKNHLPNHAWDFVWNEQPLLAATGGWHHGKDLYLGIYSATLSTPNLLVLHIVSAVKSTLQQMFLNQAGDGLEPLTENGAVAQEMKKHFPLDYQGIFINGSAQQKSQIDFGLFNTLYNIIAALLILITLFMVWRSPNPYHIAVLGIGLFFVVCNAFITANLANVLSRLNARTLWLIPMICMAIISSTLIQKRKRTQSTL